MSTAKLSNNDTVSGFAMLCSFLAKAELLKAEQKLKEATKNLDDVKKCLGQVTAMPHSVNVEQVTGIVMLGTVLAMSAQTTSFSQYCEKKAVSDDLDKALAILSDLKK